jgi:hypothetical protein
MAIIAFSYAPRLLLACLIALIAASPAHTQPSVSPVSGAASQVMSLPLQYNGYGVHFPQGLSAVRYAYGPEGMWKHYSGLLNIYGYYNVPGWVLDELLAYANGTRPATNADPNNNVLFNLAYDSTNATGTSFHEHNGRGIGGAAVAQPFTQFWFDDNFLARYMAQAYGAPLPDGLFVSATRWQILGFNAVNWPMPQATEPDQFALMGLYYLSRNNINAALSEWSAILHIAGTSYDATNQRYGYPGLTAEYYLGLFKILTDRLMDAGVAAATQLQLIQHSISLRSDILSEEQIENGTPIGWLTARTGTSSLINIETLAVQTLALGAGARYSFEADQAPMRSPAGLFIKPGNVLSAIKGQSPAGFVLYGPYVTLPTGSYFVDFYLRAANPAGLHIYLDVHDASTNQIVGSVTFAASTFPSGNQWARVSIPVVIRDTGNSMEFRVNWNGAANMDIATVRIRGA